MWKASAIQAWRREDLNCTESAFHNWKQLWHLALCFIDSCPWLLLKFDFGVFLTNSLTHPLVLFKLLCGIWWSTIWLRLCLLLSLWYTVMHTHILSLAPTIPPVLPPSGCLLWSFQTSLSHVFTSLTENILLPSASPIPQCMWALLPSTSASCSLKHLYMLHFACHLCGYFLPSLKSGRETSSRMLFRRH